jgi:hypothetical protein
MPAALIPAAIGVIGSAVAAGTGVGKDTKRTQAFGTTSQFDNNRFEYGGKPGGALAAAQGYTQRADNAQNRQGVQINYDQANQQLAQGQAVRAQQAQTADLMMQRATGGAPLVAQMQADRQMEQAAAQQMAAKGSARGAAAMALADQNAAGNTANAQANISANAQIAAAQEQLGYLNAANSAFGNLRQADQGWNQNLAQQGQFQGQMDAQQRQLNDQYALGMHQNAMGVNQQQLDAQMNQQRLLAGSYDQHQALQQKQRQANADRDFQYFQGALGAAQGGFQGASMSGGGGRKA